MKKIKTFLLLLVLLNFNASFSQYYGYVNEQNSFVIEPKFIEARDFKNGIAAVQFKDKNGWTRWRFINENGDFMTKMKYWSVNDFNDGFTTLEYGIGYWGIINTSEKIITSFQADFSWPVVEGMVLYRKKNKVGFLNTEGKKVVKPIYDSATIFSNGYASVQLSGLYGFIDKTGKVIVPIKYTAVKNYINNKFKVCLKDDYFEIDSTGKETAISKEAFDKIEFEDKVVTLNKDLKKYKYLKVSQQNNSNAVTNNQSSQTNSNISVSSYALDIFKELGSMVFYKGTIMYVVKIKGTTMQDAGIVSARASQLLGFSEAYKYQWFAGNDCNTLKSKYGGGFTVICQGELDLDK